MGDRVILHCDLNCFFASVELLSHPDLRDIPTAVCGDPASRHGIILAKNEPAKRLGIQTAETIWQAKKKCPGLVLLPPHHGLYREYSRRVNAIYEQYTDLVEPFGIDESWLDITGSMHLFGGDPKAIADALRRRLRQELGLTISVGVSFNKVFAKLGSDYKKPDATTVISRENWQDIVWPLPVGDLLFVGRAAGRVLHQYGLETIGQLAACSPQMLETLLGKLGLQLHEYANGLDGSPVRPAGQQEPVKSVGNGTTFPKNLTRWEEVQRGLAVLSDSGAVLRRRVRVPAERPVPHRVPADAAPGPHPLDEGHLAGGHGADPAAVEGPGAGTDAHRHRPVYHRQRRLLPAAGSVGGTGGLPAAGKAGEAGAHHGRHPWKIRPESHLLRPAGGGSCRLGRLTHSAAQGQGHPQGSQLPPSDPFP